MRYVFKRNSSIGAMDAESDQKYLRDCFYHTGDIDVLLDCEDPKRIIVGRVGAGKSALINQIKESSNNTIEIKAENLSLNWISNSDIIQFFENAGVKLDLFYQLLWRHVFVVELLKKKFKISEKEPWSFLNNFQDLFQRNNAKKRAIAYLQQWGDKFWQDTEIRIKEFATKLEQELKGSIEGKFEGITLSASGGKNLSEEVKAEIVQKAQSVVNSTQVRELGEIISFLADDVFKDQFNKYYITIDKLDESWVDDKIRYKLIRALIETIKSFQKVRPVKIIMAIREDLLRLVFEKTRDAGFQEEKYESLYLKLRWKPSQLKDLIDLRISKLIKEQYTNKRINFDEIFKTEVRGETAFDYLIERTLNRPRDVIAFVNQCIEISEGREFITPSAIQDAEKKYSEGRFSSLIDEWFSHYPSLKQCASLLRGRSPSFKYSEIRQEDFDEFAIEAFDILDEHDEIKKIINGYLNEEKKFNYYLAKILRILYVTSIIGIKPQASEKISWSYIEDRGVSEGQYKDSSTIYVHKMLWKALEIQPPSRLTKKIR